MGRPGSQRWQSMRFVGGQGAETKPEPKSRPKNEPEPEICKELDPVNTYQEEPLPMRQWMRWRNCKTYELTNKVETYPSIRPPINKCCPEKTLGYVDDSMEANQCGRMFQMGKDNVLAVWNQSPRKDTLAWYGVGERAGAYKEAVAKSLKAASMQPKHPKKSLNRPVLMEKYVEPRGPYVLDRICLKTKLDRMPNVRHSLKASNAFTWLYCPPLKDPDHPFEAQSEKFSLVPAPAKPAKFPKRGLRRKQWYCPPRDKEAEENKCIQYEMAMMSTRQDLQREMDANEEIPKPEPRNYDELFQSLGRCFVQNPDINDTCEAYEQCCKDPEDPPAQGCNEFTPEGPEGGGKFDDNNADSDNVGKGNKGVGKDGDGKKRDRKKGKGDAKRDGKGGGKDGEEDGKDDGKEGAKDGKGDGQGGGKGNDKDGKDGGKDDGKYGGKYGKGDGKGEGKGNGEGDGKVGGKYGKGDGKGDGKEGGKYGKEDVKGVGKEDAKGDGKDGKDGKEDAKRDGKGDGQGGGNRDGKEGGKSRKPGEKDDPLDTGNSDDDDYTRSIPADKIDLKKPPVPPKDYTNAVPADKNKFGSLELTKDSIMSGPAERSKFASLELPSAFATKPASIDYPQLMELDMAVPIAGVAYKYTKKHKGKKKMKMKKIKMKISKDMDCPCVICCQVAKVRESPLIKELRQKNKERELRDYLRRMRHRQYMACKASENQRFSQHKCDCIESDTQFCLNSRLQTHLGRVRAIQQLQQALRQGKQCDNERIFNNLNCLLSRLCDRLSRSSTYG